MMPVVMPDITQLPLTLTRRDAIVILDDDDDRMELSRQEDLLILPCPIILTENTSVPQVQSFGLPETASATLPQTDSRTDYDRNKSDEMLIHELSFSLNQNFTETLSAVTTLVALYNDVLFEGTFTPKVSSITDLTLLITTAWDEFSKSAMEERAVADSTGFTLPTEARERDLRDLSRVGSLTALIEERQRLAAPDRFNIDRCNDFLSDVNPIDLARLRDIAVNGSRLPLHGGFKRQVYPNKVRSITQRLGNTFEKYGYELWLEGRVLLLPLAQLALYDCDTLNFSCDAWWVGAPGKPAGRMLLDPTHAS
jgi:hypothetical protein